MFTRTRSLKKRHLLLTAFAPLLLAGCMTAPNTPSIVLGSAKSPEAYAQCVYPKWQDRNAQATLTQKRDNYTITAPSRVSASQVLEVHKAAEGSNVSIYLRGPLASTLGVSSLEDSARSCL